MSKKVLVVEDETPLSLALEQKFSKAGYEVEIAKNGQEGLEVAQKFRPDIILLDIVMPVMDGMTMLSKLKEMDGIKEIPVIILSNLGDGSEIAKAMKLGTFDYVVKTDVTIDNIMDRVKSKIG